MNLQGQVSYQIWLKLPKEVRDKLVVLFHIPRSGSTVVDYGPQGNVVVSDGYKPTDIEAITLEKMQALLDTDSANFYQLFSDVIEQIDRLSLPTIQLNDTNVPAPLVLTETITETISTVVTEEELDKAIGLTTRFCDSCDSKGGRHKKGCPKR